MDLPWLEPVPDALVATPDDPAAVVVGRASVRLALVAALQTLPPRQRAVLVLRDVLQLRAAEVAEVLDTTTVAVNSALQRARAQLEEAGLTEDVVVEPADLAQRQLLDRYCRAIETKDVAALVTALAEDAVWEMPPFASWFRGPEQIGRLVGTHCPAAPGEMRLLPTRANGQQAYALYILRAGEWQAFQIQVLEVRGGRVAHVVAFFDLSLFDTFGLPRTLPAHEPALLATA
jgi:RNA polymerase sigma-70 factor (ECF subfamily)